MVQRQLPMLSFLLISLFNMSFGYSLYGTIYAEDAMDWIQKRQPAPAGGDAITRWFWNPDDANINPARKAATDPAADIHTPWKDPINAGKLFSSCQVAAINLAPFGVQTTWAQIKMAVLSILAHNADGISLPGQVFGGIVYLGSLAIILYNPSSQFANDLAAAISTPSGLNPAAFVNHIPAPPRVKPQPQGQNRTNNPIGPLAINLGAPSLPESGMMDCYSTSSCPTGNICQVTKNDDGSSAQGCMPSVSAMLDLAYDLASASCIASPALCALSSPPSTLPPDYLCACNCTYAATSCCTAPDGMVSRGDGRVEMLSPIGGMCCNQYTGEFETTPEGEENLDGGGFSAKCRHEPMVGANNIGRIHTRGETLGRGDVHRRSRKVKTGYSKSLS